MKNDLIEKSIAEETVLFISVVKWVVLGSIVGALVGCSTALFLGLLDRAAESASRIKYYYAALPAALLASVALVNRFAPDAKGHGTEKVIEAFHRGRGKIKTEVVPVKLAATVLTIAAGGSAGKEGPCAQIGAGLAALVARLLRFDDTDRKKLVICGISSGFASVFGAPFSGAVFGVEVLFVGGMLYEALLPSFISGVVAYQAASSLGVEYFHHPIKLVPVFTGFFFAKVVVAGVFFGLVSLFFIETMKAFERISRSIKWREEWKALAGGAILAISAVALTDRHLGLGIDTIQAALEGQHTPWHAFAVKAVATSATLNIGGSGGVVTPIFYIGSTAGSLFGNMMNLDAATFAAIGFVAVLAGAANTPIAAGIMAVEMFGPKLAPYATVACVVSFLMTGHRSVYPSQILGAKKSSSLSVDVGADMEHLEAKYSPRKQSLTARVSRFFGGIKESAGSLWNRRK
ncbi:MAG TPA: chloride channel protein [bacterium]|nr:chloride channel protein [bacterium]